MRLSMEFAEAIGLAVIVAAQVFGAIYLGSCGHIGDVCHIPGWAAPFVVGLPLIGLLWVAMIPSEKGLRAWWKRRQ